MAVIIEQWVFFIMMIGYGIICLFVGYWLAKRNQVIIEDYEDVDVKKDWHPGDNGNGNRTTSKRDNR